MRFPSLVVTLRLVILCVGILIASQGADAGDICGLFFIDEENSTYFETCETPCVCTPETTGSLFGYYELSFAGMDGSFEIYAVDDVSILVPGVGEAAGSGEYRIDLSQSLQELTLELDLGTGLATYESGVVTVDPFLLPLIDIEISTTFEECFEQGFHFVTADVHVDIAFLRGDANGDGAFDGLLDSIFLLSYGFLAGQQPPCLAAADTNDDGIVNPLQDAILMLSYAFVPGTAPPPPPFPECAFAEICPLGCDDPGPCL